MVQLLGPDHATKLLVAADAAARLGRLLYRLPASLLPPQSADLEIVARLWARESLLLPLALYLDADSTDVAEPGTASPNRSHASWPSAAACSCSGPATRGRT